MSSGRGSRPFLRCLPVIGSRAGFRVSTPTLAQASTPSRGFGVQGLARHLGTVATCLGTPMLVVARDLQVRTHSQPAANEGLCSKASSTSSGEESSSSCMLTIAIQNSPLQALNLVMYRPRLSGPSPPQVGSEEAMANSAPETPQPQPGSRGSHPCIEKAPAYP